MIDKTKTLDIVCNLANTYDVTPRRVIEIYNRAINKDYIDNQSQAMKLTKRYVRMNYNERQNNVQWEYIRLIDFNKKRRW